MRILRLDLLAFGPFTGASLDLSSKGMHVVYGRNEAGKSTTLRALTGLLYGIPATTADAHLHAMKDLRVGGTIEGHGGEVLRLVRRKGNTRTLLSDKGEVVEESRLTALLGGVSEALFRRMFGLDHEALRAGGEALARGRGDIGESLFQASMGAEVHRVLSDLKAEAERLFLPRAQTRELNKELAALAKAQKDARDLAQSPQAWLDQEKALREANEERRARGEELRAAQKERSRLARLLRLAPLAARRARWLEARAALGDVARLPETAPRDREAAVEAQLAAEAAVARLTRDLGELAERRAGLVIPEALVAEEGAIERLQERLGSERKAMEDLPKLLAEVSHIDSDVAAILARLRLTRTEPESLRIDPGTQARVHALARDRARLEERLPRAKRDHEKKAAILSDRVARAAQRAPVRDPAPLKDAARRARQRGDLSERLAVAQRERARRQRALEACVAALAPWAADLAAPVPALESVERAEQAIAALLQERSVKEEAAAVLARRAAEIAREQALLSAEREVPKEAALEAARAARDAAVDAVIEAWSARERFDRAQAALVERAVREADALADRLRRESDRVTRAARLEVDATACAREIAAVEEARCRLTERAAAAERAWGALWAPAAIVPGPPSEMRAWLGRHAAAVTAAAARAAAEEEVRALEVLIAEHSRELVELLGAPPEPARDGPGSLAALLDRAEARVTALEGLAREAREADREIDALSAEVVDLRREREAEEAALAAWQAEWAEQTTALGLPAGASPEHATALLDELSALFKKKDEADKTRRRVASIRRDAERFAEDVRALALRHAPDVAELPADEAAAELLRRHRRGKEDLAKRLEIDAQIEDKRGALASEADRARGARARLEGLVSAAGVTSVEELAPAEERSARLREVERQLGEVEAQMLDEPQSGGTLESIAAECAAVNVAELSAMLDEVDARVRELDEQREKLARRIGGLEQGLEVFKKDSDAPRAAAEAQEALARVRSLAERYVQVRLAAVILAREIERWREKHQGPVLSRASELFRELTRGAYAQLRADVDERDQAVLACVRAAGGAHVDVQGLSDGTRDQLFLALRVATLERYFASAPPMPVVVDDVLIHFDDERARAALAVFGGLAERTQVLFFTHHARLAELAREVIPPSKLHVHGAAEGPVQVGLFGP